MGCYINSLGLHCCLQNFFLNPKMAWLILKCLLLRNTVCFFLAFSLTENHIMDINFNRVRASSSLDICVSSSADRNISILVISSKPPHIVTKAFWTAPKLSPIYNICDCQIIKIIVPFSAVSLLFSINFPQTKWSAHLKSSSEFFFSISL